ncbi:Uncharacterised protein [uncultured archaeon]|nr:Uncharacterised protein [uncultured archaeon]
MRLVGFNFTKLSIERLKDSVDSIKFNTKIDISSIESLKSDFIKVKDEALKIDFVYSVLYEPGFAKLELAGTIILSVEPKIAREVLKGWKDKQMTEDFRIFMFNIILRKSSIKALEMEEELGLPTHIPIPSLTKENIQEKKE